jgi:hypothetical protein
MQQRASVALSVPKDVQTFADEGDRSRLSATAIKAFRNLTEHWALSNPSSAALLSTSLSTWERIKRGGREEALSQDQFTRISALVGIYKGLHLLFAGDAADRWPRLANKGPIFEGSTPIDAMIRGGIPRMLEVRRYIDAVRGGL